MKVKGGREAGRGETKRRKMRVRKGMKGRRKGGEKEEYL